MTDEVRREEEAKLNDVLTCVDYIITKCDKWLEQRVDIVKSDRDSLIAQRKVFTEEKDNMSMTRPNPYFGRIDIIDEENPAETKTYYFGEYHIPGSSSFLPDGISERYVLSNNAPIARLFYQPTTKEYEATINGPSETTIYKYKVDVKLKRLIIIENSHLIDYKDEYVTTYEGQKESASPKESYLTAVLNKTKGNELSKIVVTIQPEQYEAIASSPNQVVLIQGAAGSGKSEIGLHRIAYLLSPHNELNLKISPENVVFFGPSAQFLNYISNVLPSLQVQRVQRITVHDWLKRIKPSNVQLPKKDTLLENLYDSRSKNIESQFVIAKLKSSSRMADILEKYIDYRLKLITENTSSFIVGQNNEQQLTSSKVKKIIRKAMQESKNSPLNEKREKVLSRLEAEMQRGLMPKLSSSVTSELKSQFNQLWPSYQAIDIYKELFDDGKFLGNFVQKLITEKELTILLEASNNKKRPRSMEDIAPICYLNYLLNGFNTGHGKKQRLFEHVILDEAQDISLLEMKLLYKYSATKSFTILGDTNQYLLPYHGIDDWKEIMRIFSKEKPRRLDIRKSYRSTAEITKYANHILKRINPTRSYPIPYERHGEKPVFIKSKSRTIMIDSIIKDLSSLQNQNVKTIAIFCKTPREASKIKNALLNLGAFPDSPNSKIQLGDKTITISSIYEAKGLEFDAVLLVNSGANNFPDSIFNCRLLYIGVTRASHKLHVHWYGKLADILDDPIFFKRKRKPGRINSKS